MSTILGVIRGVLGFIILGVDRLTAPRPPFRTPEEQRSLDTHTSGLTLYHLEACPFCVKVRREILRRGLNIRSREIRQDEGAGEELITGGKIDQVPCLRIGSAEGVQWMYESSVINEYLAKNFPIPAPPN